MVQVLQIVLFVIFAIANAIIAKKKGFSPWAWVLAAGFIGLLALHFMPSSKELGINEQTETDRRRAGNLCGALISFIALIILVTLTAAVPNI
jgi:hypothetical protein